MYDLNPSHPKTLEDTGSRRGDPLVGRTLNNRFRIAARLAKGGMGKVYRAQQVPLGRAVALKVLNVAVAPEHLEAFHRRFFIEAATAARLSHPHTVTIFDYGCSDDGIYYIAMELLEGPSLRQVLNRQALLPPRRAVALAIQIARAVREAHGLGFMHRDLKPANVVLLEDDDGRDFVKVLDFGLAKSADQASDLTRTGQFLGSPGYMAPEQIRGDGLDARCDIYALGAMLFEMLTGRAPFVRKNAIDTLMAHVHDEVPSFVEAHAPLEVPAELEAVVRQCLAKAPPQRPQDMSALMVLLRAAVAHLPAEPGPLRAVGLDEYEASGWAVISPTGALRIQLGDELLAASSASADDAVTMLELAAPPAEAEADATLWSMPERAQTEAPTLYGAAIAAAAIKPECQVPMLYCAPPAHAPADTVAQQSPVQKQPAADATAVVRPSVQGLGRPWRVVLLGVLALLYPGAGSDAEDLQLQPVALRVRTMPAGARVWQGDALVCERTPCEIEWRPRLDEPVAALRFFADGYDEYFTNRHAGRPDEPVVVTLTPSSSHAATD